MGQVVEVVLVALLIAVMVIVVVVSYWGLWRFVRWSNREIAKDWRSMDRRRRLVFVSGVVVSLTVSGLFVALVMLGETGLVVALAVIYMATLLALSMAVAISESRRARRRVQSTRDADGKTDAG